MHPISPANCQRAKVRQGVTALMLGLWFGVAALVSSPALHRWLHQDSDTGAHECVVTLISKSHLAGGVAGGVPLVLAAAGLSWLLPAEFFVSIASDVRLSPGRAPPGAFFFLRGC